MSYLEIAKKVGRGEASGSRVMSTLAPPREHTPRKPRENEESLRPDRTVAPQPRGARQKRHKRPKPPVTPLGMLTVAGALEEMESAKRGPGIQARLYQAGEISRENAVRWISCAIICRREGKEALFDGWRRHARTVEEALDRFCRAGCVNADSPGSTGTSAGS